VRRRSVFLACVCVACLRLAAWAVDLPAVPAVPDGVSAAQREALSKGATQLAEWKAALEAKIAVFNQQGRNLPADKAPEYERRRALLLSEIREYIKSLNHFKDEIKTAQAVAGQKPAPDRRLTKEEIRYFLWERPGSVAARASALTAASPFPGNPEDRLVNPLDTRQEALDRELLQPVDQTKLEDATLDQVCQIFVARRGAREREASRKASRAMNEEMKTLEGTLRPGESLLGKARTDADFGRRLSAVTGRIARQETADVRAAWTQAMTEMRDVIAYRARTRDPIRVRALLARTEEILARMDATVEEAHRRAEADVDAGMWKLMEEWRLSGGEDAIDKDRREEVFRRATDTVMIEAFTREHKTQRLARDQAQTDLVKAYEDFVGK